MDTSIKDPEEALNLLQRLSSQDTITLRLAEVRNIILVGRSRSGKSTVFKMLKKATYVTGFGSLFAETKDACLHSFTVDFDDEKEGSKSFTINIIDTPGLFEVSKDKQGRNNEIIKTTISTCLTSEITKVHAIFFVCSFESGVQEQDIQSFLEFVEFFKGAESHLALLITRAETFSSQKKTALIQDVKIVLQNRNLPGGLRERIFFSGALSEDVLEDGVPAVSKQVSSVRVMRSELFEWVFSIKDFCQLDNLDYFQLQNLKAKECLEKLEAFVKGLPPKKEDFERKKPEAKKLFDDMAGFERFIFEKADQKKMQALLNHGVFSQE